MFIIMNDKFAYSSGVITIIKDKYVRINYCSIYGKFMNVNLRVARTTVMWCRPCHVKLPARGDLQPT
jgi:hypothetical protein